MIFRFTNISFEGFNTEVLVTEKGVYYRARDVARVLNLPPPSRYPLAMVSQGTVRDMVKESSNPKANEYAILLFNPPDEEPDPCLSYLIRQGLSILGNWFKRIIRGVF